MPLFIIDILPVLLPSTNNVHTSLNVIKTDDLLVYTKWCECFRKDMEHLFERKISLNNYRAFSAFIFAEMLYIALNSSLCTNIPPIYIRSASFYSFQKLLNLSHDRMALLFYKKERF